jgi:hypothetical protein
MQNDLTFGDLDGQSAELLPSRETLFFNTNWTGVYASNTSLALNAATVLSEATSAADQRVTVTQD